MKILAAIIGFFGVLILSYLVGSFVAATWDITQWDSFCRFMQAMITVPAALGGAVYMVENT